MLIDLRVNDSVFEPETAKLHPVDAHYHLLNSVRSAHQQTSLQLLPSMVVILLLLIIVAIQIEVSSLIVLDLSDLCHDFLRPHYLPHPPSLDYRSHLLHYTTLVLLRGEEAVNFEGADALPHVPPPVKFLDFGRTFVHVDL